MINKKAITFKFVQITRWKIFIIFRKVLMKLAIKVTIDLIGDDKWIKKKQVITNFSNQRHNDLKKKLKYWMDRYTPCH